MSVFSDTIEGGNFVEVAPSVFQADILSKSDTDKLLSEFEGRQPWDHAKVAVPTNNSQGVNDIIGILDLDQRNAFRMRLRDLDMSDKIRTVEYLKHVQNAVSIFATAEFGMDFNEFGGEEIVRYPLGGLFSPHTDTHKGNSQRAFTVIIYLNDSYEAGETFFPDLNYTCTPKAGRVLVFMSTELHSGLPVKSGEKYIMVFWGFFPGSMSKEQLSNYHRQANI